MKPILIEIVSRVLTSYDHCHRCAILFDEAGLQKEFNENLLEGYPQDLREECAQLSEWIRELTGLYKHRLLIRIIDAHSPAGMVKCLRHWIRKYPTFIINGKKTFVGWDKSKLEGLIDKHIQTSIAARKQSLPLIPS
jgi:hypothetical protein